MLALDHRGSFQRLAGLDKTRDELIEFKKEIILPLLREVSGLLIDNDYGLPAYKEVSEELDLQKSFLMPLEGSGYRQEEGRVAQVKYSAEYLKDQGASGAKLLIYLHPQYQLAFKEQLEIIEEVLGDCEKNDLPLFLEILTYGEDHKKLILPVLERIIEKKIRPAVFKLEYPGSIEDCQKITDLLKPTPWVLLSRGIVSFEEFQGQLDQAVLSGASGFLVGRALWQEVFEYQGKKRKEFLGEELITRFLKISNIMKL